MYSLPPLELHFQNPFATLAPFNPSQITAVTYFPELDFDNEVFLEVALLLFTKRGHFLELDYGGSIYFRFLLLTQHEGRVEDVADNQIFTNHATLFKF